MKCKIESYCTVEDFQWHMHIRVKIFNNEKKNIFFVETSQMDLIMEQVILHITAYHRHWIKVIQNNLEILTTDMCYENAR